MASLAVYISNEELNYQRIGGVLFNNKETIDPAESDLVRVYFDESEMDLIWDQPENHKEKFAIDLALKKMQQLFPL
jgi:hypothetical protein